MSEKEVTKKFPEGFLWGATTAAYQVEGGIENVDWAEAARRGEVPTCGRATDHYHRYQSDFDIAKSLGQNAHRFSIEWARIEPEEGKFNEVEILHYQEVLRALRARGLEPFVTLWHFTLPIWFSQKGGFTSPEAPELFSRYCEYVVSKLGDNAKFWITMNEPLVWATHGYLKKSWPPFKKNLFTFITVQSSLVRSHVAAYEKIKKNNQNLQVGIAKNNIFFTSTRVWWSRVAAFFMNWFWNDRFLNAIYNHQDFIGLNHYFYKKFGSKEILPKTDMEWDIFPQAIYHALIRLNKYGKPIYITENGLADEFDVKRRAYIRDYLSYVKKAIDEGVPVRGYFYWSLLDNYEWSFGFSKRFGLVEVNYITMERIVRSSAQAYKEIAERNALE